MVRRRKEPVPPATDPMSSSGAGERQPLLDSDAAAARDKPAHDKPDDSNQQPLGGTTTSSASAAMLEHTPWIPLAVASGACASFNGVFAKLTTTELTSTFAASVASVLGWSDDAVKSGLIEAILRAFFFSLNLIFNGIMWALFTAALARGSSTTRVSIINTSSNFLLTAILGFAIFSEALPPLWWLGAALLVAGTVIIGRREEDEKAGEGAIRVGEDDRGRRGSGGASVRSLASLDGVRSGGRREEGEEEEADVLLGDVEELDTRDEAKGTKESEILLGADDKRGRR